jgi:endoglucanase
VSPPATSPESRPLAAARSRTRRLAVLTTALVSAAAVGFTAGTASAGTLTGTFYREPDTTAVARWVAANPNDSRTPVIRTKIASQPASHWLSVFNLSTIESEVAGYVGAAAAAGQLPVLTAYGIPNRDCGGASAGGAPNLTQYQTWVAGIARGIGGRTTIVVLEPDSIALQTCLSAGEIDARNQALRTATQTLRAAGAKVYLDAGHSAWNSAADQAGRLVAAGQAEADGFYTNVSNFQPTASEAAYGRSILSALTGRGVTGKRQIIDTSRNGGAAGDWCGDDNTDRRIGQYPTTATGDANIDAYIWVKPPGEADGCRYAAGSFQPDLAYSLASTAPNPPTTPPTTVPTTTPTTTPTTAPTTPPPAGPCSAAYQTTSTWQGGFQGQVTVTAGSAGVAGWQVTWTLGGGQSISQVWGGTLSVSGSTVTVRNAAWNGRLQPNATAEFGFLASGAATVPAVTCSAQ